MHAGYCAHDQIASLLGGIVHSKLQACFDPGTYHELSLIHI